MIRFISIAAVILIGMSSSISAQLQFKDVHGRWKLRYRGNYGYEFRFNKSYRAICILYLRDSLLIFKGVYTIEDGNKLRVNISEMKNQHSRRIGNLRRNFTRISSSYFIFNAERKRKKNKHILELKPVSIVINGNRSDGYFEPHLKLVRY